MLNLLLRALLVLIDAAKVRLVASARWLARLLEKPTPAPPRTPTPGHVPSGNPDTEECRVAVHEIGHALVAWPCTVAHDIRVAYVRDKSAAGRTSFKSRVVTAEDAWCDAVITMAGVAAEGFVYGSWRSGRASSDLATTRLLCRRIGSTPPPWRVQAGLSTLDFDRAFEQPLSEVERDVLQQSYRMARHIIELYGTRYHRCVSMLIYRRELTERDLQHVLGSRVLVRTMHRIHGSTFVLPDATP